jgi:hypothetical protein
MADPLAQTLLLLRDHGAWEPTGRISERLEIDAAAAELGMLLGQDGSKAPEGRLAQSKGGEPILLNRLRSRSDEPKRGWAGQEKEGLHQMEEAGTRSGIGRIERGQGIGAAGKGPAIDDSP